MKKRKKSAKEQASGLIFVGCMFIGMALGFLFGNVPFGLFGGMGVGFITMGLVKANVKPQEEESYVMEEEY
jgi:hypothetical protein